MAEAAREVVKVVRLKRPIHFGSEVVEELQFRRGRLGDAKGVSENLSIEDLIVAASRLSGQTLAVIERVDEEDAAEVLGVAADFLRRCLGTGETASPS